MSERSLLNVRVNEDTQKKFEEFAQKEGESPDEMGYLVEKAMKEYMDGEQYRRLEEDHQEILDLLTDEGTSQSPSQETTTQRVCHRMVLVDW